MGGLFEELSEGLQRLCLLRHGDHGFCCLVGLHVVSPELECLQWKQAPFPR
jgi:hypothetical protein